MKGIYLILNLSANTSKMLYDSQKRQKQNKKNILICNKNIINFLYTIPAYEPLEV